MHNIFHFLWICNIERFCIFVYFHIILLFSFASYHWLLPIFIIERNRFVSMNFKPLFCFSLFQKFHVQKEARLLCGIRTASKPTILIYHWIPIISNSRHFRDICCNHGKQCLWLSRGALLVGESLPQTPFSHDKSCGCAHPSGRFSGRRNTINVLFSFPSVVPFLFLCIIN